MPWPTPVMWVVLAVVLCMVPVLECEVLLPAAVALAQLAFWPLMR